MLQVFNMANKTEKLNLTTLKPGTTNAFDPVFTVESCEGRAKAGGDHIYATLQPTSGGANLIGPITFRMPALLAPGSPLNAFAVLVGQDPTQGFDVPGAVGARVRLAFAAAGHARAATAEATPAAAPVVTAKGKK